MTFEDIIEYPEEVSRKRMATERELDWNLHLKDRFSELFHNEERWSWKQREPITFVPSKPQVTIGQSLGETALKNFTWNACILPHVEKVLALEVEKDEFDIWTVITDFDEDTEEKLAQAEVELVRSNPDLKFDFMVIPRMGRDLAQMLPKGKVLYSKK